MKGYLIMPESQEQMGNLEAPLVKGDRGYKTASDEERNKGIDGYRVTAEGKLITVYTEAKTSAQKPSEIDEKWMTQ